MTEAHVVFAVKGRIEALQKEREKAINTLQNLERSKQAIANRVIGIDCALVELDQVLNPPKPAENPDQGKLPLKPKP